MGRGRWTLWSDSSGGAGEVLPLGARPRVTLTIKSQPRSLQATSVLTNLPFAPREGGFQGWDFSGGFAQTYLQGKRRSCRQTPGVRAQPWRLQREQDEMAGAVFLFGSHLSQDALTAKCKNGAFGNKSPQFQPSLELCCLRGGLHPPGFEMMLQSLPSIALWGCRCFSHRVFFLFFLFSPPWHSQVRNVFAPELNMSLCLVAAARF